MRIRTTTGAESGHAEFTVTVRGEVPDISKVVPILNFLRDSVLGGRWYEPKSVITVGCRLLRVVARDDGTLGLEEQVAPEVWEERVDEAIIDLHNQAATCEKLGFKTSHGGVSDLHAVSMHPCAATAAKIVFSRGAPSGEAHSGWMVVCMEKHEHQEAAVARLGQVMADFPYLRQFLALPPDIGVIIMAPPRPPSVTVIGIVMQHGKNLTPGGLRFGPEPILRPTTARAHFPLCRIGDGLVRTMQGEPRGLPDIVARTVLPAAEEGIKWSEWVLDPLQDAIADGTRFAAGQSVRSGWRSLRLITRPDGMLGLEERIDDNHWAEQVDHTVREQWEQRQVVIGLGLEKWLHYPADGQDVSVAECVDETVSSVMLSRTASTDPDSSGWTVSCGCQHEHGEHHVRSLWDLTRSLPFVTRFLALPGRTTVTIETPRATDIRARVLLWDKELIPEPGSHAAALLGTTI